MFKNTTFIIVTLTVYEYYTHTFFNRGNNV